MVSLSSQTTGPSYHVTTDRTDMVYDGFDRLSSATTKTHTVTVGTDITQTADRTFITYNALGDIAGYTEAVVSNATPNLTDTTDWTRRRLQRARKTDRVHPTDHQTGTDPDGSSLDATRTTVTTDMQYDDRDRLIAYDEQVSNDDATGVVTNNTISNIQYDALDHQIIGDETSTVSGPGVDEVDHHAPRRRRRRHHKRDFQRLHRNRRPRPTASPRRTSSRR